MTTTYLERILDPWREFDRMSRLLNRTSSPVSSEYPAVNVWVNGDNAVITTEIPGIERDTIDISVTGNTVSLSGSRPAEETKEEESYHRHELWHGKFSKMIKLPFNIDADKVKATYSKGVLQISLPQLETDKPRKINIK
ncbi:MAG: Hsp20/alpha crystallin family protein [Nitrospiraceae bacterium]|nr:MAG: Hsp20/alpha crystallin family protein [Nitrospiraceae bacterium]